jgi:hypothetical protein
MSQSSDPLESGARAAAAGSDRGRSRLRTTTVLMSAAILGGVLLGPQLPHTSGPRALARGGVPRPVSALTPPSGSTWITGVVTDQAAHGQDNVNVEAWPDDPTATEPAASALTYGGPEYNAAQKHGFFRLEVPSDVPYRIVFSAVGGKEDGDPFRMHWYGAGRPIEVRTGLAAGRIRNLGTIPLARQGKVASTTKAVVRQTKIRSGTRGKVRVTVSSRYVTDVTGRVVVKVAGRKISGRLTKADHGKLTMRLPKIHRPGMHRVAAHFAGSSTVHSSSARPVKIRVV